MFHYFVEIQSAISFSGKERSLQPILRWQPPKCVASNFDVSLTLANDQLDAQFFFNTFIQSSKCFEQHLAHPQEVKLY
jgi:hypothetical protein